MNLKGEVNKISSRANIFAKVLGKKLRATFWGQNLSAKNRSHRMMKRHMVSASGLTIEESERMVEEAETDEEIEEQVE